MEGLGAEFIGNLLIYIVILLLAISAHEAAHAWMSLKFGDDTAFQLGRVTLNPISHTDIIGTLLLPILGFIISYAGGGIALIGWGKPTPVNPRKWTNYKRANVMVSIAGILANIILAIIGFVIFKTLIEIGIFGDEAFAQGFGRPIALLLQYLIFMNVSLAIFNLMPFPPLDGSKILSTFLPTSFQPTIELLEQYGFIILLVLINLGFFGAIINPVFALIRYVLLTPIFQ
jgi:Zn-dependent protease